MTTRKTIFITGGGSGIGRATAQLFAQKGWLVGIGDIDSVGMAETKALLPAGQCETYALDVRIGEDWDKALAAFWDVGGRLDVLFNNAGIARGGMFAEVSAEDKDQMIAINFSGVVRGAERGFPKLSRTPGSCLLNTCSASGIYGTAGLSTYSATKFAVRGLTEALEVEWAPHGIKVRSLMPGFIDTPLLDMTPPGSNQSAKERVAEAGFEVSPASDVAQAAWNAVHGDTVHVLVGKTARRLSFIARFAPGLVRKQSKKLQAAARV